MYAEIYAQDISRPSELWGQSMSDAPSFFEGAPFLSAEVLWDPELIRTYAKASGELPGSLTLPAVFSRYFSDRLVLEKELLHPEFRRTDA